VEIGLFTEFEWRPGVDEAQPFNDSLHQVTAAEDLGYDAVWLAELHFQKERSVLSSPVVGATIAGRTKRVKIGFAVQVLPLIHPLRLAEDVATLDQVSKGRLDFGVGRSGLPGHYTGFNIPYEESQKRFDETLEILLKAWTEERFTFEGMYFQFHDVCAVPKPYQKPHPPLRVAATSEESYAAVGRGLPIFLAVRTSSISEFQRYVGAYHAAWREAGHPGRGEVAAILPRSCPSTSPTRSAAHGRRPRPARCTSIARSARRSWPGHAWRSVSACVG
jgi:alkanesulfonate monooxygenase SsuD/methylene tetrahydromethanopterin reductase-like flavin-dependent oxidoreductase (luciferase family)